MKLQALRKQSTFQTLKTPHLNSSVFKDFVRIQGVLCVNKDNFPARVAVLPWQLSSDWTKTTQDLFYLTSAVVCFISRYLSAIFKKALYSPQNVWDSWVFPVRNSAGQNNVWSFEPVQQTNHTQNI